MKELHYLTIGEASAALESRKLSPVELTKTLLDRAAEFDAHIHSYITITAETALKQARAAEVEITRGNYRGAMHGIPYGLKDLIATAGILTTGNSRTRQDHVPGEDAGVVTRLAQAGAVLLGKQTAHEFAHGGPSGDLPWPPARNPWNVEHFTGGSSSGSAAGVAAGFAPAALGTDTGGSIRSPASYCGLVGLKPTYGLVSRRGVIPHSFSLDHCGPITRTVEDCAIVLQVIAGHDPGDPASAKVSIPQYTSSLGKSIKGLRVGVLRHIWEQDNPVGEELAKATEEAIVCLKDMGATVEPARVGSLQSYRDVKAIICESEAFAIQKSSLKSRLNDFGADYLSQILLALLFQAGDYAKAQRHRRVLSEEMLPLYRKFDVLVTAGSGPAPRLDVQGAKDALERWAQPSSTAIFNVTGAPALMLCSGFSKDGLPVGLQLAGRPFDEASVLQIAHAYQQETQWHQRHPVLTHAKQATPFTERPASLPPDADPRTCAAIEFLADIAGIRLSDAQIRRVAAGAPMARQMARRIPDHGWEAEPAGIFNCVQWSEK